MHSLQTAQPSLFGKFLVLWSGKLVAAVGTGLTSFGLGVYVFQQTGQASALGLITLLAFVPSLILSAPAGVLADRYDRRLLMVLGEGLSVVGLLFILICLLQGEAQLWQICVGVTISSIFSSLVDPAYKATITDLLPEEQYTKATGLMQLTGSAKYLISPIIAGYLLIVSDIKLLLLIDICTLFVTIATTLVVKKTLATTSKVNVKHSFWHEFQEGFQALSQNKGVLVLVIMTAAVVFCIGIIQVLSTPMLLAFSDSAVLGTTQTLSATGMLVTSLIIGIYPFKKGYMKILSTSLFGAGICMIAFGLREDIVLICIAGFLFFAMLPYTNTSLDYLIRINLDNAVQGRAWGLIGVISQLGYVLAYAISGVLADVVFTPWLLEDGILADSVGLIMGTGSGRGTGLLIMLAGSLLCVTAMILYQLRSVRQLERRGDLCTTG